MKQRETDTVLLLTACVRPNGMTFTSLTDIDERMRQYVYALKWYLENTSLRVVVVENTGTDFSDMFNSYADSGRLEFITFDGNDFDKTKGKGYGEGIIIKKAFETSRIIGSSKNVMKITGRLVLSNIQHVIPPPPLGIVYANLSIDKKRPLCHSYIFFAPGKFYKDYFIPNIERIDDSNNYFFESLLYDEIEEWVKDGNKHRVFKRPLKIIGNSGTDGHPYYTPSKFETVRTYLRYLYRKNFVKNNLRK